MKLVVDVLGFEGDPKDAIKAIKNFATKHTDANFIIVGDSNIISKCVSGPQFEIVHADKFVNMHTKPLEAIRDNTTSMYKAISLVAEGKADGVLSAGSSNCYVSLCFYLLKTLDKVEKFAFMPAIPTTKRTWVNLLDVGANRECTPNDIYKFAVMGNCAYKILYNVEKPRVGMLNIATEETKASPSQAATFKLIKENNDLNFIGYVEPYSILSGDVDVCVCDGYSGNLTLKSLEVGLKSIKSSLKSQYSLPWNWLGAIFSLVAIKGVSKTFDYRNNAGALLLGLKKLAVKTHGAADYKQFYSSIRMMYKLAATNFIDTLNKELKKDEK